MCRTLEKGIGAAVWDNVSGIWNGTLRADRVHNQEGSVKGDWMIKKSSNLCRNHWNSVETEFMENLW
jgi:hypothetical protein